MGRERLGHTKNKTMQQPRPDNPTHCDAKAIGLMVAGLNYRYRGNSVYCALLNAPGIDTATLPALDIDKVLVFNATTTVFGLWSTLRGGCLPSLYSTALARFPAIVEHESYNLPDG